MVGSCRVDCLHQSSPGLDDGGHATRGNCVHIRAGSASVPGQLDVGLAVAPVATVWWWFRRWLCCPVRYLAHPCGNR
jgi:hypothetical protein